MKAYTNTLHNKTHAVKQAKWHKDADMLVSGTYGEQIEGKFKACSVGCMYKGFGGGDNLHVLSESIYGIPEWLTRLQDSIFEGLPESKKEPWHVNFFNAIPKGAELDKIKPQFMIIVLESLYENFDHKEFPDVKKVIDDCVKLWKRKNIGSEEWKKAARSAESAAESAAWSAAWSAAESAAESAQSAESAAWSAAESAAESARSARPAKYEYFAKELLKLIRSCK